MIDDDFDAFWQDPLPGVVHGSVCDPEQPREPAQRRSLASLAPDGDVLVSTPMIIPGDCLAVLCEFPDALIDAVVTDPPYGLEFMGKEWDGADGFRRSLNPNDAGRESVFGRASRRGPEYRAGALFQEWSTAWATEALRVLKPGGYLLAFGGTRTSHRLACAVEDAGFEIRDSIAWLYGSGFPKSLDVSKAIDKAAGADPIVIGPDEYRRARANRGTTSEIQPSYDKPRAAQAEANLTTPATEAAQQWSGWGTALKPAFEPIIVARKPLRGTVAANVLEHGTGALNIDGCRIGTTKDVPASQSELRSVYGTYNGAVEDRGGMNPSIGRWPANVVLDEDQAAALDEQSGLSKSPSGQVSGPRTHSGIMGQRLAGDLRLSNSGHADSGGASRFFYCAKAPKRERPVVDGIAHPTVKPLALMRWLVRLVTPPGGTVLDPFAGSGTTIEAALLEGFDVIAIEREAAYLPLIQARIDRTETVA